MLIPSLSRHPAMRIRIRKPYSSCAVIFIKQVFVFKEIPIPVELLPTSCFYPRADPRSPKHKHHSRPRSNALSDLLQWEATVRPDNSARLVSLRFEHY